jgi:septal ring factor EnvC (AmiA/AmiB activator)
MKTPALDKTIIKLLDIQNAQFQNDMQQLGRQKESLLNQLKAYNDQLSQVSHHVHEMENELNHINEGSSTAGQNLLQATQQMQETQMSFNLQYLQLQNSMQNDNRQFTMVSNIMKTKHDTAKNTISNIH